MTLENPDHSGRDSSYTSGVGAEEIKQSSNFLRGSVREELDDAGRPAFSADNEVILKFHGIYQQDDRDVRRARAAAKEPLAHICMVRAAIPGGRLSAQQFLALDALADEIGDGSLRITTRQGLQYHFVPKHGLRALIRTLNEQLVTTLAACGDVVRNVMYCPAPFRDPARDQLTELVRAIADRFRPRSGAYYEIWLDGERAATAAPRAVEPEPIYGPTYLPRKFKIAVAHPGDNCIDAYAQDVAVVPVDDGGTYVQRCTILVGGGFGVSHADSTTYPRAATPLTTVGIDEVLDVIEAIVTVQRDNGQRGDRKHARLKYLIDRWGLDHFRSEVEARVERELPPALPVRWAGSDDHLGWHERGDGKLFLGMRVPAGRLRDGDVRSRSAVRAIVEGLECDVRFTPNQDIVLDGIPVEDRGRIDALLGAHGVEEPTSIIPVLRRALACPALPTCGLALTEAERVLDDVVADVHAAMAQAGIGDEEITFRMTGCPNGCARPYSAEIGLVGRTKTSYDILIGGDHVGRRLTTTYRTGVKRDAVGAELAPLFARYVAERGAGERFGDWCHRSVVQPTTPP